MATVSAAGLLVLVFLAVAPPPSSLSSSSWSLSYFQKAFAETGSSFDGVKIHKLADYMTILDGLHNNSMEGSGAWFDGFDWSHDYDSSNSGSSNAGENNDNKFFIFRFCAGSSSACSIWMTSFGPDGSKEVKRLFDASSEQFSWIGDIKLSPLDDSVLFKAQYNDNDGPNGTLTSHEDLFRYVLADKKVVQISSGIPISASSWMPDGHIAYIETRANATCPGVASHGISTIPCSGQAYHYNSTIWLADPSGKQVARLYNGAKHFGAMAVSPDGTKMALSDFAEQHFLQGANFWNLTVFDIGKKDFQVVAHSDKGSIGAIRWTPDGQSILYVEYSNNSVQDRNPGMESSPAGWLNLVSAQTGDDGMGITSQIIFGNSSSPYTAPPVDPAISPDGRSLIFGINYDVVGGGLDGPGIYEMEFAKPIPEYGSNNSNLSIIVMAVEVAGVVVLLPRFAGFKQHF